MVYLPPPQLASASRPSYAEAYAKILASHRRSPLTSASSVILLVAPDVDALCAARMLAELLKQDDVMHRIIPVSGHAELEDMRTELLSYDELHTLILLNMGSILTLTSDQWLGEFSERLSVHVIDSTRPRDLSNLFDPSETGERVIVWDDGEAENMEEMKRAWEAITYEPEPDSDEDDDVNEEDEVEDEDEDDDDYMDRSPSGKRKSQDDDDRRSKKRRKTDNPNRMTRDQYDEHAEKLAKYYRSGASYGQSAASTVYILATVLERVDVDLLWLAILGLTYQYSTARISRTDYDKYHTIYYDEVFRLNPIPLAANGGGAGATDTLTALSPDDLSVRATEELRFMLFRHWNLYDAMYHSSYVASKLGIWKERGRKRLTGLLAKMGFSIPQTQQPYTHMDLDLKQQLRTKLDAIAPEYGLVELSYPSFARCFGYRAPPLSAADAVEAASALLDVAGGIRMEVEVEGMRNGGEWFGGGRVWEGGTRAEHTEKPSGQQRRQNGADAGGGANGNADAREDGEEGTVEVAWWVKNFWAAYDALTDIVPLREALSLSMSLHRAIIRQGTSIIDKQDIRTMRSHRVVVLTQGPDLPLFTHPGVLSRLALWLVDALRDRIPGTALPSIRPGSRSKKSLPFVVACLNERAGTYVVVGVMGALEFNDVRKNEFGVAFMDAKERCNARTKHTTFDTNVLEINQDDLKFFLETLCEVGDGY
ncbi:CDC45-like protein [Coniophora puteana RWD-64-598 SS2]|uniref:CDC45-like protein n=1 Tax=Coniophora puteana (strain RWD-64-598) TaxID=741705 RepID=A0A5M3N3K9_CONPW|nr:CDC45-like protein [Coniophora puteana RWD-64-598 SS2]EIW85425.1 CDC45-like protein [Coniophora puteana RWD-64-598 SS2]